MTEKLKIGIVGLVHDHVFNFNIIQNFLSLENVREVCVSDVNEPLLEKASKLGVNRVYKDYVEMLAKEDLDAVCIFVENAKHAEYVEAAAKKRLHVMVEKPLASNLKDAKRIFNAVNKYNVKLMVHYPPLWFPTFRYAVKLAKEGILGKIYEVRFRGAHMGPKEIGLSEYFCKWLCDPELNGGGAYIDFCCFGANFARWMLGMPDKVIAISGNYVKNYVKSEDNAILLMKYPNAIGVAEASWSQVGKGNPFYTTLSLLLRGSEGDIMAARNELLIYLKEKGCWDTIQPPLLEEGERNGPEHFVTCLLQDRPFIEPASLSHNLQVQAILEAGILSMYEERAVSPKEIL